MTKETIRVASDLFFETLCRALLSLLLVVLLAAMAVGIFGAAADLLADYNRLSLNNGLHNTLKHLVTNVLMVLAVVELFRTVKAYFTEGRLKVTYIIDTALVVVITELMGFWYREVDEARVGLAIALVVALMFVRIMAIRFSPKRRELLEGL
ncbi:MAG: phosphate-starvation-inducible PsiE family protein [Desulfuromonas sp.]|nr:phosphate-starvation-inducible PsiE family protein [Desulfuromonas sp.]